MFGDLCEALANVSLELGIRVGDKSSEVWNCALVDDSLSKFLGVFSNFGESGSCDSLEGQLGLLNAKDEETDSTSIDDGLSELMIVLSDAT